MHWSTVGDPKATDRTIKDWAEANGCVDFTHDLDFGTILALTHKTGPVSYGCAIKTCCLITWETWSSRRLANINRTWKRVPWSSSRKARIVCGFCRFESTHQQLRT